MKPNELTKCGFEQREVAGDRYWNDEDWVKVDELRKQGKYQAANMKVMQRKNRHGVD